VRVTFHGKIEKGRIVMYRRIGILSFSSPGHYYPLTALGRRLQSRGHDVVYFQVADLESPIRAAGLRFRQIGEHDFPLGSLRARDEEGGKLEGLAALRCGIRGMVTKSQMVSAPRHFLCLRPRRRTPVRVSVRERSERPSGA